MPVVSVLSSHEESMSMPVARATGGELMTIKLIPVAMLGKGKASNAKLKAEDS